MKLIIKNKFLKNICLLLLGLFLVFNPLTTLPVSSRVKINIPTNFINPPQKLNKNSKYEIGQVYLDGRIIISLTNSLVEEKERNYSQEIILKTRDEIVQERLIEIAKQVSNTDKLEVEYRIEPTIPLPQIYINDLYLMTVTNPDADIHGLDTVTHAKNSIQVIKNSLILYQQERETKFLIRQLLYTLGIIITIILINWLLKIRRNKLKSIHEELVWSIEIPELNVEEETAVLTEKEQEEFAILAQERQEQITKRDRIDFRYELYERLCQLAQIGTWIGGIATCLSLFPQTRWLQSLVLKGVSLRVVQIIFLTLLVYTIVRLSFLTIDYLFSLLNRDRLFTATRSVRGIKRLQTFSGVLKGTTAFVLVASAILTGLAILGLDLAPLLAGAGIVGIAISFGAQSLVKDFLSGIFILWEDQYSVGDMITIDRDTGLVETMNLRITQIRSHDGELITIPNGSINKVKNLSNKWSRVNIGIDVAYNSDLKRVIMIIRRVGFQMAFDRQWREFILETPKVLGVDKFDNNGVTIRVWIKTQPLKHLDVGREFRLRLKSAFDSEGISIPFPQRSIWFENSLSLDRSCSVDK